MARPGWRTVTVRADTLNVLEAWSAEQPMRPSVASIVRSALRSWCADENLPFPEDEPP